MAIGDMLRYGELTLGSDRRHGAQPERREGRDRGGHGRVSARLISLGIPSPACGEVTRVHACPDSIFKQPKTIRL